MESQNRKTVFISGATSGIGLALAENINNDGHFLILSGRDRAILETLKERFGQKSVMTIPFDLSKPEEVKQAIGIIKSKNLHPDMIIHSGGLSQREDAVHTEMETVRYIMEVNFFSTIMITQAFLPEMIAKNSGNIILISSLVGKFGTPKRSTYSASKHALHGYYDSLRAELHTYNIQVTLLCPGYINTDISINAAKGDGSKHNNMDENQKKGMPPDKFAKIAWKKIQNGVPEAYIGGKEMIAVYLKRWVPGLLRKIVRNVNPK